MTVTITPHGMSDRLAGQLDALRVEAKVAMGEAVDAAGVEMRRLAPGSISSHIGERVTSTASTVTGVVSPSESFARFVDEGTGIYVAHHSPIRAKRPGGVLKFRDGRYRRSSRGQRPQRFVERAQAAAEPRALAAFDHVVDATIGKL